MQSGVDYLDQNLEIVYRGADCPDIDLEHMQNGADYIDQTCKLFSYTSVLCAII